MQKRLFKGGHFSDNNPPTEKDLQAHLNSGDEVEILLQAAVSRAKRAGISRQVLSSCMDDCYQEVNCSSSITLPLDLDDVLDLGASIEGESSSINCFSQDSGMEQPPAASKDRVATAGPVHTADEAASMEWAGATV